MTAKDPQIFLTVRLTADKASQQLQNSKVIALGMTKKKNAVGYSISEVKGDAVQTAKETNFATKVRYRVNWPSVQINTNSGSISGSSKVLDTWK